MVVDSGQRSSSVNNDALNGGHHVALNGMGYTFNIITNANEMKKKEKLMMKEKETRTNGIYDHNMTIEIERKRTKPNCVTLYDDDDDDDDDDGG